MAAEFDVALLDLDGVVYVGPDAVPHAAQVLARVGREFGMRAAYVTNNASRPPATVAAHLVELGISAGAADVVTSAQAGARVLAEILPAGAKVLFIGGPGVPQALRERGFVPVKSIKDGPVALIQGYGKSVDWEQLAQGSYALHAGLPWVATNADRTIPTKMGRALGNGALVAALRYATGAVPLVAGKPEPPLMLESVERTAAQRPLVVGDRLDTDIEGANNSGIASLLVLTGVTDWTALLGAEPAHRPTFLAADLRGLLIAHPPVSVQRGDGQLSASCGAERVTAEVVPALPEASAPQPPHWADVEPVGAPLPAWIRRFPARPGASDLDVVRAVVAAAWLAADSQLAITDMTRQ